MAKKTKELAELRKIREHKIPLELTYDFTDCGSKISPMKFAQGVNIKKISLQIYLPEKDVEQVLID